MVENDLISQCALYQQVRYSMADNPYDNSPMFGSLSAVWRTTHKHILKIIGDAPAVDAEPVCHGHWIEDHMRWKCSCCRTVFHDELERIRSYDGRDMPKYCPECGAKMDGENECSDG